MWDLRLIEIYMQILSLKKPTVLLGTETREQKVQQMITDAVEGGGESGNSLGHRP